MNNKFSAVFFDLDGTLLDTSQDLLIALNYIFDKYNCKNITFKQLKSYISKGARVMLKALASRNINETELTDLSSEFIEIYHQQGHKYTTIFPGMDKVIGLLDKNNIPWGIITNKTSKLALPVINLFNFNCKTVVCSDTTNNIKPHPEPMLKACSDLNVKAKNSIYIGDAITDIQAGKSVEMYTIAACYGYIPDAENPLDWGADLYINSPLELVNIINSIL